MIAITITIDEIIVGQFLFILLLLLPYLENFRHLLIWLVLFAGISIYALTAGFIYSFSVAVSSFISAVIALGIGYCIRHKCWREIEK